MSRAIGITASALSRIENKPIQPNARTLYKIYKAYPEFAQTCSDYQQVMGLADDEAEISPKVQKQRNKLELPLFTDVWPLIQYNWAKPAEDTIPDMREPSPHR